MKLNFADDGGLVQIVCREECKEGLRCRVSQYMFARGLNDEEGHEEADREDGHEVTKWAI